MRRYKNYLGDIDGLPYVQQYTTPLQETNPRGAKPNKLERNMSIIAGDPLHTMFCWSLQARRAPSWHRAVLRVYGLATTAMHEMSTPTLSRCGAPFEQYKGFIPR